MLIINSKHYVSKSVKAVKKTRIPEEIITFQTKPVKIAEFKNTPLWQKKIFKPFKIYCFYDIEDNTLVIKLSYGTLGSLTAIKITPESTIEYRIIKQEGFLNRFRRGIVEIVVDNKPYRFSKDKNTWVESPPKS